MKTLDRYRIAWQLLLWSGGWLVLALFLMNWQEAARPLWPRTLSVMVGSAIVVILNVGLLLPKLYFNKRISEYILCAILLLYTVVALMHSGFFPWASWFNPFPEPPEHIFRPEMRRKMQGNLRIMAWIGRTIPLFIVLLGSSLIELAHFANNKEKEKLQAELKFLKSQINPHFLFNALNNIYSLSIARAPQTSESIMQLSEILRYMVYDSNEARVALTSEVAYIRNLVQLNLLKDSRGMNVHLELPQNIKDIYVPPLLFIPFVENAFKHSRIEDLDNGFIRMDMRVDDELLVFSVENSLPPLQHTKNKVGGVGLANVQARLKMLYPNRLYDLQIKQQAETFSVRLQIPY